MPFGFGHYPLLCSLKPWMGAVVMTINAERSKKSVSKTLFQSWVSDRYQTGQQRHHF